MINLDGVELEEVDLLLVDTGGITKPRLVTSLADVTAPATRFDSVPYLSMFLPPLCPVIRTCSHPAGCAYPQLDRHPLAPVRLPIVDRWKEMGTIIMGKIESGFIRVGDVYSVMPNKLKVKVIWRACAWVGTFTNPTAESFGT